MGAGDSRGMQLFSMQMPKACDGLGEWRAQLDAGNGLGRWWAEVGASATNFSTGLGATHGDEALAIVQGRVGVGSAELHILIQLASLACNAHVRD